MKACVALALLFFSGAGFTQAAYPEPEAAAAWRGLAASYVRKAIRDGTLSKDPALNGRVDAVMAVIGGALAAIDARFDKAVWKAILIDDFGHGAAAFPGETILVDSKFLKSLHVDDDELALILAHEAAHVVASHAAAKLSFMAEFLGRDKVPTARAALIEFLAKDAYADVFRPAARLQEREADAIGATIFFVAGFDASRALRLFDRLAELEAREDALTADSHDPAAERKQAVAGVIADLQRLHERRVTAVP
jgi:predicted Zn-dependent protease